MADFEKSIAQVLINEGGIANNKLDNGQFTYKGIASAYWPKWPGWPVVKAVYDKYKGNAKAINNELAKNTTLQNQVNQFYKDNFWNPLSLSSLNDEQLALNVLDFAVNAGTGTAAKRLQQAANAVINKCSKQVGLVVDGNIGPKTISTINSLSAKDVYDEFNNRRKAYYDGIIANNPSQAVFKNSWYSRIKDYQVV